MPFFRSKSYSNYLTRHSIYKSKKFFAPLQVRTHKYVALLKQKKFSGKRALSWVSFGGRRNITEEKRGSLTLEAALCFPLVVFFCVILIMPMILMDRQRQIQAAVESVGEEISQYAYVSYLYKSGKGETLDVSGTNEREGSQLLEKETVNRLFIARIGVFVTCVFPIQQFFALASASHGNFSTLLRHIQTLSLPKISSGKCSSRTGCFLLS